MPLWIWDKDTDKGNVFVNFKKEFELTKVPLKVIANIAAESRYWLYINGELCVFEGGLKRGVNAFDGYFDEVDITSYLKTGKNEIFVTVWYYGSKSNFSSACCDKGGFWFEADAIGVKTDSDWLAKRDVAYLESKDFEPERQPNSRLIESNVLYNGNLTGTGEWQQAKVMAKTGDAPYNTLHPRPIPLIRFSDIKDYENSVNGQVTNEQTLFEMKLPYNAQVTPYLEIETALPCGTIDIYTDTYGKESSRQVRNSYITAKGVQAFEGLSWFSGESVFYDIPKGVKIIRLGYRESGYDTDFTGSFECDDEFLNSLWQKSLRTLYITMRDNYMDCPDRERTQWWGDVTLEMLMGFYSLDSRSYALYEKGLYTKLGFARDGVLHTVVPQTNYLCELPMQELAGICGVWQYYMYTGKKQIIKDFLPAAVKYLSLWKMGADGLVVHRSEVPLPWMDWMDWGKNADVVCIENAWYCMALESVKKMCGLLNAEFTLNDRLESIKAAYKWLWTKDGFKADPSLEQPDDRANALAVLAGLATKEQQKTILKVLTTIKNSSPYMEKYLLDAICAISDTKTAIARIKDRYAPMVTGPEANSTLWEFWQKDKGTKNHAWTGGPLLTMSKNIAGVYPTEAGYEKYMVKPDIADLTSVSVRVPAVIGEIKVDIKRSKTEFELVLLSPAANATVAIPKLWQNTVVNTDCLPVSEDEGYIYFEVGKGTHKFVASK